jgi:hypothetical protein
MSEETKTDVGAGEAAEMAEVSSPGELPPPPPPPPPATASVLERLGSCPLPRGKFPFLGILASIYEHVHECTRPGAGTTDEAVADRS